MKYKEKIRDLQERIEKPIELDNKINDIKNKIQQEKILINNENLI